MSQSSSDYDPKASMLALTRATVGIAGAIVFFVAGRKMTAIVSVSGDSINEAFYQAMGWFSYGMAILSLLAAIPSARAAAPAARAGAAPGAAPTKQCPECQKPIESQNLAPHLVTAHHLPGPDARALADSVG